MAPKLYHFSPGRFIQTTENSADWTLQRDDIPSSSCLWLKLEISSPEVTFPQLWQRTGSNVKGGTQKGFRGDAPPTHREIPILFSSGGSIRKNCPIFSFPRELWVLFMSPARQPGPLTQEITAAESPFQSWRRANSWQRKKPTLKPGKNRQTMLRPNKQRAQHFCCQNNKLW